MRKRPSTFTHAFKHLQKAATVTPAGQAAPHTPPHCYVFTLCSGHLIEKLSSLRTQPGKTKAGHEITKGKSVLSITEVLNSYPTGWHICSDNSWGSPSGNSPLLRLFAGRWNKSKKKEKKIFKKIFIYLFWLSDRVALHD